MVTTLVSLLLCSVNSSAGLRGHGRIGDDRSFCHTAALGLGEPGGEVPEESCPSRAALLGGPLFFCLFFFTDFLKINFFYLSYWLHLLLIVCGDIESNPGPDLDKKFESSIPIFIVFMPI